MINDLKVNPEAVNTSSDMFQNIEALKAYKKVRALVGDKNITEHISKIIIDKLELKKVLKKQKLKLNEYV